MGPMGTRGPIAEAVLLAWCCASGTGKCRQVGAALADIRGGLSGVSQRREIDLIRQGGRGGGCGDKCGSDKGKEDTGHNVFPSFEFLLVIHN